MTDATYRGVRQQDESLAVEVSRQGDLGQLATGFATEADADHWIAQDKRLCMPRTRFGHRDAGAGTPKRR